MTRSFFCEEEIEEETPADEEREIEEQSEMEYDDFIASRGQY